MKKIVLFLITCLFVTTNIYSQPDSDDFDGHLIGEFTMDDEPGTIWCTDPNSSNFVIYIEAPRRYHSDALWFVIKGDKLNNFCQILDRIKHKFQYWENRWDELNKKQSKDGNMTQLDAELMAVRLSGIDITWYDEGGRYDYAYEGVVFCTALARDSNKLGMFFSTPYYDDDVYCYYVKSSTSDNREYLRCGFQSVEEIDHMIKMMDINRIKNMYYYGIPKDYDGNEYEYVQIGEQCWMAENLRTTHYSNGKSIPLGNDNSSATPCRYYPNNDKEKVEEYGYLYTWAAIMIGASSSDKTPSGVQGICPKGWHLPSTEELNQLALYLSENEQYWSEKDSSQNTAKSLASVYYWDYSNKIGSVGNSQRDNNETGFSAIPTGYRTEDGTFGGEGMLALFWCATEYNADKAFILYLRYNYKKPMGVPVKKDKTAVSVRCLRDF